MTKKRIAIALMVLIIGSCTIGLLAGETNSDQSAVTARPTEVYTPIPTTGTQATTTIKAPMHTPKPTKTPAPPATTMPPTPTVGPTATSARASCHDQEDQFDRSNWPYQRGQPGELRWVIADDDIRSREPTLDHHVALKDAFLSGGCTWSLDQKAAFSADTMNHYWTARSFNSSKGARTPDQLTGIAKRIIDTQVEKCAYATRHKSVKERYNLSMTNKEQEVVVSWLRDC